MLLSDWMRRNQITCEDLAAAVGCDTSTISRLIPRDGKKQVRRPSLDLVARISLVTKGDVTANDFLDAEGRLTDAPRGPGGETAAG